MANRCALCGQSTDFLRHAPNLCMNCGDAMQTDEGRKLIADAVQNLRQWVEDLHSGMYINCVYCGHRYGPKDEVPDSMAEVLKRHIEQCPKHPLSAMKKQHDDFLKWAEELSGKVQSYLAGMRKPEDQNSDLFTDGWNKAIYAAGCELEKFFDPKGGAS